MKPAVGRSMPMPRSWLLIFGLSVLLGGCAGIRPEVPSSSLVVPPLNWRTSGEVTGDIDAEWWRAFNDDGLNRAVGMAMAHNADIHQAVARIAEAQAQVRGARSQQGPSLNLGSTTLRERDVNPGRGLPEFQTANETLLTLSFDPDLFGRLANASAAARASWLATRAGHAQVRLGVAAATARAYFNLIALDERLAILQRTLQARQESLALVSRRVTVGYASQLDLAQAEVELRSTEQLLPSTELAIRRTEDLLNLLMGQTPAAVERSAPSGLPDPPPVPSVLPSALLRRRPDLVAAEDQLVAADHALDSARAAFMPDLQLSASYGSVTSSLLHASPYAIFSLGGSLLAPIFESGRLKAQADTMAARRDQAAFGYQKATLQAFADVEDALATNQRLGEQLVSQEGQRVALQRNLQIARSRYRTGYAPYLDQLDAQRGLLGVELSIAQSRADRLAAAIALFQAVGGGWDVSRIGTARAEAADPVR